MKANWTILTEEEDAAFDAAMREWQQKLNLMDWRIERGRRAPVSSMAMVQISFGARLAAYRTGNWGCAAPTPHSIRETALHESLHILLAEFKHLVSSSASADLIESAEHRVITTLEKILIGATA